MKNKIAFLIISLCLLTLNTSFAQDGYSSASVTMNRSNGVFSPDQVVVEEYLNYHRHNIPLPRRGEKIALSMDWNILNKEDLVLQVGITTNKIFDYSQMPPINTSIVIDKSGSMQSDSKLNKVKKALFKFIEGLRPDDMVSIVAYDSNAEVILPAQKASNMSIIKLAIKSLSPGGSTNLNGGLVLGYKEVLKNFHSNHTNRVILLTDGIANRGVVKPEDIVANSVGYNKKGIDISTIGVGNDINHSLLQQIAKKGRGLNHFVGNEEEDIVKVFDMELESLLSPVAKDVVLELEYSKDMNLTSMMGYTPKFGNNKISIPLNNINSGLTQIVLLNFKMNDKKNGLPIKASLKYTSSSKEEPESIVVEEKISTQVEEESYILSQEIKKNYAIGKMAVALQTMGEQVNNKNYTAGLLTLENAIKDIETEFPRLKDKDILRVKDILNRNFKVFKNWMNVQAGLD